MPIDIYRAQASRFQVIDGKIMPSLSSIDGLGDKAAEAVVEAARQGKFLSKEDFWQRTKVPKSVIDLMSDMGMFGDLPNTNQISLFDFETTGYICHPNPKRVPEYSDYEHLARVKEWSVQGEGDDD